MLAGAAGEKSRNKAWVVRGPDSKDKPVKYKGEVTWLTHLEGLMLTSSHAPISCGVYRC